MHDQSQHGGAPSGETVASPSPETSVSPLRAARKQVTVLFCDVAGYTSRSVAQDPEELAHDIRVFQQLCSETAEKHHGHVLNYLGDGILVVFGHPRAGEFDAEYGVRAGLEMVERVAGNNTSAAWRGRKPIRIRIGLATGMAVVGERSARGEELIFGEVANLAARMQGVATPDTVVAALRTRRLVGAAFKFRDLGERRLKGFPQPMSAWQVLYGHRRRARKRAATRFIGRTAELQCLREHYTAACAGRGSAVHVRGEPGIGKSRLIRAFEKTLDAPQRLYIACSPFLHGSPFKPIIDEAHRWLQIGDQDTAEQRRATLCAAMEAVELEGREEHVLIGELLGIPTVPPSTPAAGGEARHRRLVTALVTVMVHMSRNQPLLLILEDLHWADPSTLEVLTALTTRLAGQRLFAMLVSRSDFMPPWAPTDAVTDMTLRALDERDSARLIGAVFGAHKPPPAVVRRLVCNSGGVPLFLEESSRHVLAQSRRAAPADERVGELPGRYETAACFTLPDTLQDSLNARLDQLGEAKPVAQLAAAFGGDFRYSLLSKIAARNGLDADSAMDALLDTDLLSTVPDKTEDRYEFRHTLFANAAYHAMLKRTRERYHAQIAELLQEELGQRHPELVAYHYGRSGRVETAVELWLHAGRQALAQSAIDEAAQHLTEGLTLVTRLARGARRDRREIALLLELGAALTARSGHHGDRAVATYRRALHLAKRTGHKQQRWSAVYGLWRCLVSQAAFPEAVRLAMALKSMSRKSRDQKLLITAYGLQGMARMVAGKLVSAVYFYDQAVRLYRAAAPTAAPDRHAPEDPAISIQGLAAVNKLLLDDVAAARAALARAVEAARGTGHPYTLAGVLRIAAMYEHIAGDHDRLRAHSEEIVTLATTHGFAGLLTAGNIFLMFCHVTGDGEHAKVHLLRYHLALYEEKCGLLFAPYFHGMLAEACLAAEDHGGAMQAAEHALMLVTRYGEAWWRAPLLGCKAEASARGGLGNADDIRQQYRNAMQIAATQGAKWIERRLCRAGAAWGVSDGAADAGGGENLAR